MKHFIALVYNSYKDPLFQNLMYEYLITLTDKEVGHFHLITFEQQEYSMDQPLRDKVHADLKKRNISWYPHNYYNGRFLVIKKAWNFLSLLLTVLNVNRKYKPRHMLCFANLAGVMGLFLTKVTGMKLIVFSYEPHSEFMADLGHWSRSGIKFKLLNPLERQLGLQANTILTGTKWMRQELMKQNTGAHVYRAPTAVDPEKYFYCSEDRMRLRKDFNLENNTVFVYAGKFGGLYYSYEIAQLFDKLHSEIANIKLLILTPSDRDYVCQLFTPYTWSDAVTITKSEGYEEMRGYLSASDFGLCLIPPAPSQKYRSPTKIAEYLLCGLPYITMQGVSEDDLYAQQHSVGVALTNIQHLDFEKIEEVKKYLHEDCEVLRERCRSVGLEYRSKSRIDDILFSELTDN